MDNDNKEISTDNKIDKRKKEYRHKKTKKHQELEKKKREHMEQKHLEKARDILYIIKILDCNYCAVQKQILEILLKYNYRYIGQGGELKEYNKKYFNDLMLTLEKDNLIGRKVTPLPNGTFSPCLLVYLKTKAVAFIEDKEEYQVGYKNPNWNTIYYRSMVKGELLLNNKELYSFLFGTDNLLEEVVNNKFNTLLGNNNKIKEIYNCLIENNTNKFYNNLYLKADLEKMQFDKCETKTDSFTLLDLKRKYNFINYFYLDNNRFKIHVYITNPSGSKRYIDYFKQAKNVLHTFKCLLNKDMEPFEFTNSENKTYYFDLKLELIANNEYERNRLINFEKTKEVIPILNFGEFLYRSKKDNTYNNTVELVYSTVDIVNKFVKSDLKVNYEELKKEELPKIEIKKDNIKKEKVIKQEQEVKKELLKAEIKKAENIVKQEQEVKKENKKKMVLGIDYITRNFIEFTYEKNYNTDEKTKREILKKGNYQVFGLDTDTNLLLVKKIGAGQDIDVEKLYIRTLSDNGQNIYTYKKNNKAMLISSDDEEDLF